MKIITTLFMLSQFAFCISCNAKNNYKEYIALLKKSKCISYECELKIWNTNTIDTTFRRMHVCIQKNINDSMVGAMVFLKADDFSKLYDGKSVFLFEKGKDTIMQYPAAVFGPSWLTGNVTFRAVLGDYLENPIRNFNNNASEVFDSVTENGKIVSFLFNDSIGHVVRRISYFFNNDQKFPERIHFYMRINEISFYRELVFKSVNTSAQFSSDPSLISQSPLPIIKQHKAEQIPPSLKVGDTIPWFSGRYLNGDSIRLSGKLPAKLTVIDFWFVECLPCLESIPHLNTLYSRYRNRGLAMIGLISTIKNSNQEKKLNDFSISKPIDYPIVLASREVDYRFKISIYPTLLIVDSNGVIVYSQSGFAEKGIAEMETVIQRLL